MLAEGWTNDYVGIPWEWQGRDRDGIDCYGLLRLVYAEQLGVELPEHQYETTADVSGLIRRERQNWKPVDAPEPLDVAIVDCIQRHPQTGKLIRGPHHLAIYLGDGLVMDAMDPPGVVVKPLPKKIEGWLRAV